MGISGLAVGLKLFEQSGFQGGLHAGESVVSEVSGQVVSQIGVKAGVPDAVNLLFDLGNRRHNQSCE
jgi:hypothetical protein